MPRASRKTKSAVKAQASIAYPVISVALNVLDPDPEHGVRNELERRAESCAAARVNGWRTAAYRAWSKSDWFCDDGFLPDR